MDEAFQKQYQAAERAYGLGEYTVAHAIATELFDQLQQASHHQSQAVVLQWRAVVSLLLGHIQLHGLNQLEPAAVAYQEVLDSAPEATIAALAEQGLEQCRSENTASEAKTPRTADGSIPDLLKDPFLSTDPDQAKPAQADVVTAMPWLASAGDASKPRRNEEKENLPTPSPAVTLTPAPVPVPSPEPEPEAEAEPTLTPEPHSTTEQPPSKQRQPTPQTPSAQDLLKQSWIRRQLEPEIENPTDSTEPMGLISRIKRAFARSTRR